jgi:hypothetical protein
MEIAMAGVSWFLHESSAVAVLSGRNALTDPEMTDLLGASFTVHDGFVEITPLGFITETLSDGTEWTSVNCARRLVPA